MRQRTRFAGNPAAALADTRFAEMPLLCKFSTPSLLTPPLTAG